METRQHQQLLFVSSVMPLPAEEVEMLYPPREDFDFDLYLLSFKQEEDAEDAATSSSSSTNNNWSTASQNLHFVEYFKNPLFDSDSAATATSQINISPEEALRYSQAVKICANQGDPHCKNWPYMVHMMQVLAHVSKQQEEELLSMKNIKKLVDEEFSKLGYQVQFHRDVQMWKDTVQFAGDYRRREILRRIFTVIRWGGLLYKRSKPKGTSSNAAPAGTTSSNSTNCTCSDWDYFSTTGYPLASVLCHGGRIMIQFDKATSDRHAFWRWLMTGSESGNLSEIISTNITGDLCASENRLIFKRYGATHALDYFKPSSKQEAVDSDAFCFHLPHNRNKVLKEVKTIGVTFRDTKILRTEQSTLKHHRHWGFNIPFGGEDKKNWLGKQIKGDGRNGHLYIYYMSAKDDRCGGIMIGLEGSEFGKTDTSGGYHGVTATSNPYSPSYGYKWFSKAKGKSLSEYCSAPYKYDSLFVDVTHKHDGLGWTALKEKYEKEWNDDLLAHPTLDGSKESTQKSSIVELQSKAKEITEDLRSLGENARKLRTRANSMAVRPKLAAMPPPNNNNNMK